MSVTWIPRLALRSVAPGFQVSMDWQEEVRNTVTLLSGETNGRIFASDRGPARVDTTARRGRRPIEVVFRSHGQWSGDATAIFRTHFDPTGILLMNSH